MALAPVRIENTEIINLIEKNAEIEILLRELRTLTSDPEGRARQIAPLEQEQRENRRQIRELGYRGGVGRTNPTITDLELHVIENGRGRSDRK